MPELDLFFHGTLAVVDLKRRSTAIELWPGPLREQSRCSIVGGSVAADVLASIYGNALILAAGPLTGTMAPGSGLLVAWCSKQDGKAAIVPLLPRHGPALKAAGIDFVVITGTASEPTVLTIAGGAAHLEPTNGLESLDVPGMRKALNARRPDHRQSLILCGPAGRSGSPCASAGLEVGTSLDRNALAGWMFEHNLAAVALAGGGRLPAAGFARSLLDSLLPHSGPGGFMEVLGRVDGSAAAKSAAGRILGRSAACYLCPRPCLAYLKPEKVSAGGLLCIDHAGFAAICEACPGSVPQALQSCARLGIDPVAAAPLLRGVAPTEIETVLSPAITGQAPLSACQNGAAAQGSGVASWPVPVWPYAEAAERLAAGLVLGICPVLMQRCPQIPLEKWLAGLDGWDGDAPLGEKLIATLLPAGLPKSVGQMATEQ